MKHESDIEEIANEVIDVDDQEDALLERLSSFQDEIEKLRKEIRSRKTNKRPRKVVKKETKVHFIPGEVIDLT